MAWSWREWVCGGAGASVAVALWLGWRDSCGGWLALVGCVWLARWLASTASLWLAPALPRRLIPDLRRRAVFVTGCDSGFGHAAALRLDAQGVGRVFAGVLLPQGAGALALRDKASPRLSLVPLDVTDAASVARARALVEEQLLEHKCELWAVVNNAGILKLGESEWMDVDDTAQVINVNTLGQIRVTNEFLPLLRKSKGRVVNVISLVVRVILSSLTPYTISKFAALGYFESLRYDLSKFSVSVHAIEPWIYQTELAERAPIILEEKLQGIPENIKTIYNDGYIVKIKKLWEYVMRFTTAPKSKIYQVVDAIEDACISQDPLMRYVPGEHSKIMEAISGLIHCFQPLVLKFFFRIKEKQ